ncbi:hypothetical protein VPNG_08236 [Cytospora leucostoma]|uniref:N-acetyltransferase domain-containing protein n=1 Tax=Cytospora leucostoma TaxID=1230097 RepID=A0A423W7D1_9PEZI|nr:hypothetical protein VPNG_08236 [Cytospora leucostoma]
MSSQYTIRYAREDELPIVVQMMIIAFRGRAMNDAFFPERLRVNPGDSDELAFRLRNISKTFGDSNRHHIVAVDGDDNLIGYAEWTDAESPVVDMTPEEREKKKAEGLAMLPKSLDLAAAEEAMQEAEILFNKLREALGNEGYVNSWSLNAIAVNPTHQRKGIGKMLTQWGIERAANEGKNIHLLSSPTGDSFTVGPSALRHIKKFWPAIFADIDMSSWDPLVSFHKINGNKVSGPERLIFNKDTDNRHTDGGEPGPHRIHRAPRPRFTAALLGQVLALGIEVTYSRRVVDYFENEDKAGVVLEDGSNIEADVVVAADGVGTKSHKLISGHVVRAMSSNYSIFRTAYPFDLANAEPELAEHFPLRDNGGALGQLWQTDDLHIFVGYSSERIEWGITHKDIAGTSKESWGNHVSPDYVVQYLKDKIPEVPEYMHRILKTAPENGIVDWKLLWRDPQPNWSSPLGRVVQVGDSAHTLVPSSGNGLVQGIEDAITFATCLELGGNLRSFINQSHYLKPEWGHNAIEDAAAVKPQYGWWIWGHDPERYAYENYSKAFRSLVDGTPFENTNIPRGYHYKPWTLKDITNALEQGEKLKFEGDWS